MKKGAMSRLRVPPNLMAALERTAIVLWLAAIGLMLYATLTAQLARTAGPAA
jgi:hypothetical protein